MTPRTTARWLALLIPGSVMALIVYRAAVQRGQVLWVKALRAGLAPVAIGLLMASRGIRTASGCGWLTNALPTDERTVAYLTRTDVTQGYEAADHVLQCDCTNAHHLGALFGRLGHFMEQVFDRIRTAKAEALK